jgi:hypothetical protein
MYMMKFVLAYHVRSIHIFVLDAIHRTFRFVRLRASRTPFRMNGFL